MSLCRVLAHIVGKQVGYGVFLAQHDLVKAYFLADKTFEFIGRNLSQSFESGNFRILYLLDGFDAFLFAVAVANLLLVFDTEQGRLKDIDMPLLDQVGEELEEESQHKKANVHSVNIGIGGNNDLIIPQLIESVLDIQCRLQAVELLVLIDHRLAQSVRIQRLSPQGEHGLGTHIAALGDRTRCGKSLCNKNTALLAQVVVGFFRRFDGLGVVVVYLAVAQFWVVEQVLLGAFAGGFGNACYRLALFLRVLNLL